MVYFAASTDDLETNTRFAESLSADYPILADPDKKAAKAYGVLMPVVAVPKRWTFVIGPDGKILDIDTAVNASTAGPDLAAKLEKLGVAKAKAKDP